MRSSELHNRLGGAELHKLLWEVLNYTRLHGKDRATQVFYGGSKLQKTLWDVLSYKDPVESAELQYTRLR
jgi:hypothetical protein